MTNQAVKKENINPSSIEDGKTCCSAPKTEEPSTKPSKNGRHFAINGLCCAEEVGILTRQLKDEVGGEDFLAFDILNKRMTILEGASKITDQRVADLVAETGMSAKIYQKDEAKIDQQKTFQKQKYVTILSAIFWWVGFLYHGTEVGFSNIGNIFSGHEDLPMDWFERGSYLLAILFGSSLVAPKAFYAAKKLSPDMNLLMIVAVIGAIILGEYFEAATVSMLFALSLTLESWSVGRARNAVSSLLDLAPKTAIKLDENGNQIEVDAKSLNVGDQIVIRAGDQIATDGVVVDGAGEVNEAPITGESKLVNKHIGDEIFAGSINGVGNLTVQVTKKSDDTMLAKIIDMVSDAHAKRAPVEQWVTKFARIYTPIVMLLAILIAIIPPLLFGAEWQTWFYNALILLVIACPCALVISTPVSIVAALSSAAKQGVLIKGGAYLEAPSRLNALAMDKTGTLTYGEPEIVEIYHQEQFEPKQIIQYAAALEMGSSHPIANAIMDQAKIYQVEVNSAQNIQAIAGKGIIGQIDGRDFWLGSKDYAISQSTEAALKELCDAEIFENGNGFIILGEGKKLYAVIEIADKIREDAAQMVKDLHQAGVSEIAMVTGDQKSTAQMVADKIGIDKVYAQMLPDQKVDVITKLNEKHEIVAMIGDGINDAPAMARADFAIAMGAVGSDAAIETADIALMSDDLSKLAWLVEHSKRAMSIIRQNISIALFTKAIFVILTAMGMASMWGAIIADVGISLLVVANALRLLKS